jgi:uncharacterized protein (TIGR03790 family)
LLPSFCLALSPKEVLVVANKNAASSISLAKYYMKKRNIPRKNLLALWTTDKEYCSREEYQDRIAEPVRLYLHKKDPDHTIRCLLLMYGMPLKITGDQTNKEKTNLEALRIEEDRLFKELKALEPQKPPPYEELRTRYSAIRRKARQTMFQQNRSASVDSEIALVLAKDHPLSGWLPNPFFLGRPKGPLPVEKDKVLMVSRLDGPSADIVRRIINDSLSVEKTGLKGVCYMDARLPMPKGNAPLQGYAFYDRSIHRAGMAIEKAGIMPVVIDSTPQLFQPGQCPKAALYCGWYHLARYIPAFQWQPGAVGYHIASGECATLRNKNSQVWCKRMLEEGVAATIGPVEEPYVQSFPVPEIFFQYLTEGYLSLAECYLISLPYLSWKMVLVGDPLYRPFKYRMKLRD